MLRKETRRTGLKFTKMHGLGNDFMVIDGVNQNVTLDEAKIKSLSCRDTGIGFDQCLIVETSQNPDVDFHYRIFNADGYEVGQCGNGARCLALFVSRYGLTRKHEIKVATDTTFMTLRINEDDSVSVKMDCPKFSPQDIPFIADEQQESYSLQIGTDDACDIHVLSVGNPHAVMPVNHVDRTPVERIGKKISEHEAFPEQVNAGFMEIIDANHIKLRVYERGCGETKACGSGAVAAAACARLFYNLDASIKVSLPGGDLSIFWPDTNASITMTGPAAFVYEGVLL